MFKQGNVLDLKLDDIDFPNRRIRNVRINNGNSDLIKWLELEEMTVLYLEKYLEYRETQKTKSQKLLICNGDPLTNAKISNLLGSLKRKENKKLLGDKVINQELLIRTMIEGEKTW